MHCIIIGLIVSCTGDTPRVSPAEAAAILKPNEYHAPMNWRGPYAWVVPSSSTAGPFGEFKPFSERIHLDGTPMWVPPVVYGDPFLSYGFIPWLRPHSFDRRDDRRDVRPNMRTNRSPR